MKVSSLSVPAVLRLTRATCFAAIAVLSAGTAVAQDNASLEELEKQVEQQRIALEEAIENREKTAAKAQTVQEALSESEERRRLIEEELKGLCAEQEELKAGTLDGCMNSSDS